MNARGIRAEVDLEAPASRVWAILMDFDSYKEWNPFMIGVSGGVEKGASVRVTAVTPSGKQFRFEPQIVDVTPGKRFSWREGSSGLFERVVVFEVDSLDVARSRFIHSAEFRGALVPFKSGAIRDLEAGYTTMNEALKARAERQTTPTAA
ncbi:MAG: SRPBCC domain-containing protein [Dehalococcoidia bacterium]